MSTGGFQQDEWSPCKFGAKPAEFHGLILISTRQNPVCCVLYHLSMDDKVKSMFTYTECIPVVMRLILETTEEQGCLLCQLVGYSRLAIKVIVRGQDHNLGCHFLPPSLNLFEESGLRMLKWNGTCNKDKMAGCWRH